MNRQLESMTKLKVSGFDVRVWRTEQDFKNVNVTSLALAECARLFERRGGVMLPRTIEDVAEYFASLPEVAAVEVLHKNGDGVLIYPDWK